MMPGLNRTFYGYRDKAIFHAALAILLSCFAPAPASCAELCYKYTSLMWDPAAGKAAPVTPEALAKLRRAFSLWEEASGGALTLRDAGFSAPSYDGLAAVPYDGCVHAVLYGERNFHGELAHARYNGEIPGNYKRGYLFISRNPAAMDSGTLIHEIGHTLGLGHAATPASVMFSGEREWGRGEPPSLPGQDAADLRALWAADGLKPYSISGVIETSLEHPVAFVFAADKVTGRTYSARADHMGRFSVAVPEPGAYKLAAKAAEVSMDLNPEARSGMSAAWYVSAGVSDPDPARGAVFLLSGDSRSAGGLRFRMLDAPAPFRLTRAAAAGKKLTRLVPGDSAVLTFPEAGGALASVKAFGDYPDYYFEPLKAGAASPKYRLKIFKRAVPGERLVLARHKNGKLTVGLVGIEVVEVKDEK